MRTKQRGSHRGRERPPTSAPSVDGAAPLPRARAREILRVAHDVSYLCREIEFVRVRLIEVEAAGRGLVARIRALAESGGSA